MVATKPRLNDRNYAEPICAGGAFILGMSEDPEERIEMAEAALEISADCADAFTLLGDEKAMSAAEGAP